MTSVVSTVAASQVYRASPGSQNDRRTSTTRTAAHATGSKHVARAPLLILNPKTGWAGTRAEGPRRSEPGASAKRGPPTGFQSLSPASQEAIDVSVDIHVRADRPRL